MTVASASNVLVVVLDTVRADHLSVYGYDRPTSPTLESFAEEATVYEQAVAPAPWTLPVHASVFTGLYPSEHGATQEDPYLDGATTLAESLSAAGYATACYSANAWITPYTRLTEGFDDQDNFFRVMPGDLLSGPLARAWQTLNDSDRLRAVADGLVQVGNAVHERLASGGGEDSKTPTVVDRTTGFIDGADPPFFAFINLMDAHLPYHPPDEYKAQFAPGVDDTAVCQNSKEYNSGARDIDDDEWADIRGLYDAEIRHMDDQLGRLFDWLRAEGHWDDTMVVVCADHGELHGEHDLYGHEFNVYDPVVNVPLLVKHPDLGAGERDETTTVELLDLYHTILDHAGVDPGDGEGAAGGVALDPARSLLSADYRDFGDSDAGFSVPSEGDVDAETVDRGEYGFVEYHRPVVELRQLESKAADAGIDLADGSRFDSRMRAARSPAVKYIRNETIPDEGYRLDEDPGETTNVEGSGDQVVAAADRALRAFEATVGGGWSAGGGDEDGEVLDGMDASARDRLRDLGYIE